jgi:type III pantothenate kinase
MKLLLDIGNSSVNWASEKKSQFFSQGSFIYNKNNFENSLEKNISLTKNVSKILVSNVAGLEISNSLGSWVKKHSSLELWQSCVEKKFKGLKTSYSETQQMGIDRWLSMVAGWEKHQSSLCVVSCGTALTIDSVDSKGNHLGGYIIPGIDLMQKILIANTEKININIGNNPSIDYASDTKTAVNNGAFFASVSIIDRVVNKLLTELGSMPKCIISGGNASLVKPLLEHRFEYEPNLVLRGLLIAHNTSI